MTIRRKRKRFQDEAESIFSKRQSRYAHAEQEALTNFRKHLDEHIHAETRAFQQLRYAAEGQQYAISPQDGGAESRERPVYEEPRRSLPRQTPRVLVASLLALSLVSTGAVISKFYFQNSSHAASKKLTPPVMRKANALLPTPAARSSSTGPCEKAAEAPFKAEFPPKPAVLPSPPTALESETKRNDQGADFFQDYWVGARVANIREWPALSAPIIGRKEQGEVLHLRKINLQWGMIESGGFVFLALVSKDKPQTIQLPAPFRVTAEQAFIFAGPGEQFHKLGLYFKNHKIQVLEKTDHWYKLGEQQFVRVSDVESAALPPVSSGTP